MRINMVFGDSTYYATLDFLDKLNNFISCKETPFCVFMHLSKAFDTLDHSVLLHKLQKYGFTNIALQLCKNYISDRKQYVSCTNSVSVKAIK